jgi:hypothetical protein
MSAFGSDKTPNLTAGPARYQNLFENPELLGGKK